MRLTLIALAVRALLSGMPEIYRCTHCRKNDHTDAECWSTRAIHPLEAA